MMGGTPAEEHFGHKTNPGAELAGSVDMPDDTYCVMTDSGVLDGYVDKIFQNSPYFHEVDSAEDENKYRTFGMAVKVDSENGVVEYAVDKRARDGSAVQQFVEEVVGAMDDVDEDFREEIENKVYATVTDGGEEVNGKEPYKDRSSLPEISHNRGDDYPNPTI